MGNNKSSQRKRNQGRRKRSSEDEGDSDEEIIDILEIEERCESGESSMSCCDKCESLYGSKLIPIKDLSLDVLPVTLRNTLILDFIRIQEKVVVKLEIKKCGEKAGRTHASGWACVSEESVIEYAQCPCCSVSSSHKAYGGITVYTNKHVVTNKAEAVNCKVIFFYDDINTVQIEQSPLQSNSVSGDKENVSRKQLETEKLNNNIDEIQCQSRTEDTKLEGNDFVHSHLNTSSSEEVSEHSPDNRFHAVVSAGSNIGCRKSELDSIAQGLYVKQDRENKDLVALEIVFHDPRLFQIISDCTRERLSAWASMPGALKQELKQHVIVISHPHGLPKMVSVGELICLEEASPKDVSVRETRYTAATCQGSSGALVISGHYPYRPFTHSNKRKGKGQTENMSLSY